MFWIIVVHLMMGNQDVAVSGPPVAFVDPAECAAVLKTMQSDGIANGECRVVKVLSEKAEAF